MKILKITLFFLGISFMGFSQATFTEKTFNDLMNRFAKIQTYEGFAKLTSPDFTMVGSTGQICDLKCMEGLYNATASGTWNFSDIKTRQFGNTGIATFRTKHSHQFKSGGMGVYDELATIVFVDKNGQWQMVSWQSVNVANDKATDEAEIKAVIEKETTTWRAGDAKGHADCWEVRPYSRVFVSLLDGTHIDVSPENMKKQSEAMGGGGSSMNSNYKIAINGSAAWANFDEETTSKDGSKGTSHEMRMLEKVNGQWKIVGESVHMYKPAK